LSIAKRLSSLLGTKILLNTHEGIGSIFSFKLSLRMQKLSRSLQSQAKPGEVDVQGISGLLLVVVDDDPKICEATKSMLEVHGAEVIAAESSGSAIQSMIFSSRMPDLILSDYRLVDENGLECVQRIRDEFNHEIPAVIITGDTAPDELNVLKSSGMEVLYKPVSADRLLAAIAGNICKSFA
jgi:CheY-like chemotaxis protein